VYAAPITFELDGEQYVAASVGGQAAGGYYAPGYARMLVFKLGGTAKLPPVQPYTPPQVNPPPSTASAEVIEHGGQVYGQYCAICHGPGGDGMQQRGRVPDLMVSAFLHSQEGFDQVVLEGARQERGMGSFAAQLSADDAKAVREYLISRAHAVKPMREAMAAAPPPADQTGNQHQ
jgi:quinohemoprotein ethanol dehydrogenase